MLRPQRANHPLNLKVFQNTLKRMPLVLWIVLLGLRRPRRGFLQSEHTVELFFNRLLQFGVLLPEGRLYGAFRLSPKCQNSLYFESTRVRSRAQGQGERVSITILLALLIAQVSVPFVPFPRGSSCGIRLLSGSRGEAGRAQCSTG